MAQYPVHSSKKLRKACDAAQPGDVILVHGGRYDQPSRGAVQDYGLIEVPDLEAEAEAVAAEIGST